jgi:hypothetical protein
MRKTQAEMDKVASAWLESHKAYKKYLADTQVLFKTFASGWCGPRSGVSEAFDSFRQALLAEQGYSQSEIQELYPRRMTTEHV